MLTCIISRQSTLRAAFTAIELVVVMGIMLMLMGMTTPTVLKMLRQSAVHKAGSDIVDAWRIRRLAHVHANRSQIIVGHEDFAGLKGPRHI